MDCTSAIPLARCSKATALQVVEDSSEQILGSKLEQDSVARLAHGSVAGAAAAVRVMHGLDLGGLASSPVDDERIDRECYPLSTND